MGFCFNGFTQINFAPYKIYNTGSDAEVVGIGDLNNDGLNDVVIGTAFYFDPATDHKLFIFLQDKTGNLSAPVIFPYTNSGYNISCLIIDDMNNDNLNDIIITYSDSIAIFYQNNSHTFEKLTKIKGPSQSFYRSLLTGDLNNDGLKDFAVTGYDQKSVVRVYYQNTSGNFSFQNYDSPDGLLQIKVMDMNKDNRNDVVGINHNGVYIYNQNTSGALNAYKTFNKTPSIWGFWGFDLGDLNGDGLYDFVGTQYGNSPESKIELMYNQAGSFDLTRPVQYPAYDCPEPIIIGNLNCDAKNEIIVLHGGWEALTVYEQDNAGNYKNYTRFNVPYASHYNHYGMSIGDINNDGKNDIAFADYGNGLVVLINQSSNNNLVQKPQTPMGKSMVCLDNEIYSYKTNTAAGDKTSWTLFPTEAGKIVSTYKDSCRVSWNNNWRGKAGLYINVKNVCGERNSDTVYITSNRLPVLNLGRDTTLCSNSSLRISAGKNFESYLWQNNSTDSVLNVIRGGTYFVKAGNMCGNRYDTIRVADVPLPNIQVRDTFLCSGTPVKVNGTIPGNNKYVWHDNSTNPIYTISTAGNYTLKVTDANLCQNSKSFKVKDVSPPVFKFPNDTTLCKSDKLELNVMNDGCNYLWQDGSTSPRYTVEKDGAYSVKVYNECATINASAVVSFVNCNAYLDVPTAFSPDGDGLNDVFHAVGTNVDNVRFIIYNRWGQKVFESTSLDVGWDGTFQGKKLETAVFIYYVSGKSTSDNQLIQKHGNVSLVR